MSNFQLKTIQQVLKCDMKQAEQLLKLMDENNDHPNWSEFSNKQFQNHFESVLTMTPNAMFKF